MLRNIIVRSHRIPVTINRINHSASSFRRLYANVSDPARRTDGLTETERESEEHEKYVAQASETAVPESNDIPWYLREDATSALTETQEIVLPTIPANAPETLEKFLHLLANDYGLQDLVLFDTSVLDEDHPYSTKGSAPNYYILCTGKSEKHLFKAGTELKFFIKHTHNVLPPIEGMVSGGVKPVVRRRLLRRARKGPPATDNDYGKLPNSWIMCDTKVDGIYIHMLTQQRRDELNLESLYCPDEELPQYESNNGSINNSDDIFIGIKRGFHTMTPFARQQRNYSTQAVFSKLVNESQQLSNEDLKKYSKEFSKTFDENSLEDHKLKFKFYRALHLVKPESVSFSELEAILLQKYSSLSIALDTTINLNEEKSKDVLEYMKLLIDSPEITQNVHFKTIGEHCDAIYDSLSQFISKVLMFSGKEVDFFSNPEFLPLLWRLSYIETGPVIGTSLVNDIIYNDAEIPAQISSSSIKQAKNRARDIVEIIKYHNSLAKKTPTAAFSELILFTYGNDGNWKQFWSEWDNSLGSLHNYETESKTLVGYWVRLAVYLASRQDKGAIIEFLHNYWIHAPNGRSFIFDFEANGSKFGSEEETTAFRIAVDKMLNTLNEGEKMASFNHVSDFVNSL